MLSTIAPHARTRKLLLLLLVLTLAPSYTMADASISEFSRRLSIFSINVYGKLTLMKPNENIVFSPFSIQTCGAMARMGADGQTAAELDRGLGLISSDVNEIAETFHSVLASYENSNILKIANKIYIMRGYTVQDNFNEILAKKFFSSADEIDFSQNNAAAKTINDWVESKTNNLIKDLIPASALDSLTRLVLLNAIHFKGNWVHQFPKHNTRTDDFYLNEVDTVKVPMMNLKERFRYAELPELDATALELPYKDSDLSMLVILPNSRTGLKSLEVKLKSAPLSNIISKLRSTQVIVRLPKFKAEFEVELNEPFVQLGMPRMFSNQAEFGKMLKSPEELKVSKVIHKAFIEVNEEGTEAAAATGMIMNRMSIPMPAIPPKTFQVDRPFYYNIKRADGTILFTGRTVKF